MQIKLSDRFNLKKLIKFALPSIGVMLFMSVYSVVDGFFVSNFAGKTEFAAVNFIYPLIMILASVGFMFGAGGSALVSKTLGEGDRQKANEIFSLIVVASVVSCTILSAVSIIFTRNIAEFLGSEGEMTEYCVLYGRILLAATPFFALQFGLQQFLVVAERPRLAFYITLAAGLTNMIGDALFIAVFKWGVVGAAAASALGQVVGGVIPLFFFIFGKNTTIRLGRPKFDGKALLKSCFNGSSEFISNVSMSIVGIIFNYQLMQYLGENGVSAYGTFAYISFIFVAIFLGYTSGTAPIVGYNLGSGNKAELKNVFKKSFIIISVLSVIMVILAEICAVPLSMLYVGYNAELYEITVRAILISSTVFLFSGFCIYGSGLFTALNNGFVSGLLSTLRLLVFQVVAVLVLPVFLGVDGIWISITVSDALAAIVSLIFIFCYGKKKYGY